MTWAKVDDRFHEHPKLAAAGAAAWGMWLAGIAYCNRALTDGFIPDAVAEGLGGRWRVRQGGQTWQMIARCGDVEVVVDADWIAVALVDAGLWHRVDGGYQIHDYADFQPLRAEVMAARTSVSEARKEAGAVGGRAKAAKQAAAKALANDKQTPGKTVANAWQNPGPVPVPVPEQEAAAASAPAHVPAHTHEDAPHPTPNPGPKTTSSSSTDLRPHPMPVKAPKLPPPGDTTIRDRADALVQGSPAADRLRPLAEVAIEVTGYDVGIHTLAQWLGGNYSVERVRAGCAFAIQKYAGQCVPEGTVINTATRWMLKARPEEYEAPRTQPGAPSTLPEHQVRPRPAEIVPTPEQAARSLKLLEDASEIFAKLDTPAERRASA